ncbi:MAG: hypothetical protein AAGA77_19085 [Bacteroidota bacterium]
MSVDAEIKIPQPFKFGTFVLDGGLDFGIVPGMNSINVDLGLDNVKVDLGLDNVKADLGLDDVNVDLGLDNINAKVDLGLDNVNVDLGLDDINICASFKLKELPKMRVHLPFVYNFCFKVLGINLFGFGFNGKAQVITEDNPKRMFSRPKKKKPIDDGEYLAPIKVDIND